MYVLHTDVGITLRLQTAEFPAITRQAESYGAKLGVLEDGDGAVIAVLRENRSLASGWEIFQTGMGELDHNRATLAASAL